MKNLIKYTFVTILGVLAFASCTNEYEYEPADASNMGGNGYVKASEAGTSYMFVPEEQQTITFIVGRVNAEQAGSVRLTSNSDKLTVPATVDFAAGEESKQVTAVANVEVGGNETLTVSVAEGDGFLYSQNSVTFSIQVFPVIEIQYLFGAFNQNPENWKVYDLGGGKYRLPAYGYEFDIDFEINSKNMIYVKPQKAWVHETYGDVYVMGNAANDAQADGNGSCYAGMYDPETGIGQMALYHFLPGQGYFGTYVDMFAFPIE